MGLLSSKPESYDYDIKSLLVQFDYFNLGNLQVSVHSPSELKWLTIYSTTFTSSEEFDCYYGLVKLPNWPGLSGIPIVHNASKLGCIIKRWKNSKTHAQITNWEKHIANLQFASNLAEEFSHAVKRGVYISFINCFLCRIKGRQEFRDRLRPPKDELLTKDEVVCVEPLLEGTHEKLSSSDGWVLPARTHRYSMCQAFSHWSWATTNGRFLVCDLNGVFDNQRIKWWLSAPAIHSAETQEGQAGISLFFQSHQCNLVCKHLQSPTTAIKPLRKSSPKAEYWDRSTRITNMSLRTVRISTEVHHQGDTGTCYAHACATMIRAALERRGRTIVSFKSLKDDIVSKFGEAGGLCDEVLHKFCPRYGLDYRCLHSIADVSQTLRHKRPVLLMFFLSSPKQWQKFYDFFETTPEGIFSDDDRYPANSESGHAVVINKQTAKAFRYKDSHGVAAGDKGYKSISKDFLANCQMEPDFIDVYDREEHAAVANESPGLSESSV